jgi:hypothetical protein
MARQFRACSPLLRPSAYFVDFPGSNLLCSSSRTITRICPSLSGKNIDYIICGK